MLIRLPQPLLLLQKGDQLLLHLLHLHSELANLPIQQLAGWYWSIVDFILLQVFKLWRLLAGQFSPMMTKSTFLLEEMDSRLKHLVRFPNPLAFGSQAGTLSRSSRLAFPSSG